MALEALCSNANLNFVIYDTISATPFGSHDSSEVSFLLESKEKPPEEDDAVENHEFATQKCESGEAEGINQRQKYNIGVQGRKKRKRKPKICKNKEDAETQRMTHIAVERNRRKLINEHLAVLRSLMPESYVQRGDQASIVGGAIEFVKELEHLLQSLEAKKLQLMGRGVTQTNEETAIDKITTPPFAQFFLYPQCKWSQESKNKYTTNTKDAIADIEVTLIETHANLRILSRKSAGQLSKLVAGFQIFFLTILHLNVATMDSLVLFSISAKVEEGSLLRSVDDIATAVHQLLRRIAEEALIRC